MKNTPSGILLPASSSIWILLESKDPARTTFKTVSLSELRTIPLHSVRVRTRSQNNFKWTPLKSWEEPPQHVLPKSIVKVKGEYGEITLSEKNYVAVSSPRFEVTEQTPNSDAIWCPTSKLKTGNNLVVARIGNQQNWSEVPLGKVKHSKCKDQSSSDFLFLQLPEGRDNIVLVGGFIVK